MTIPKDITTRTLQTPNGEAGYRVAERLIDAGHEAWWVGGCVRDMLLGTIPHDIDIATDAQPRQILQLFPKSDERGANLGSIVVSQQGSLIEVTTFREESGDSDGRTPTSVTFTTRTKDAERRDFTVNALYWNAISRELHDPFGGEKDLKERLVRFIGNADDRIRHDHLRLLRAVRLRAQINGQYHPETFQALHTLAPLIADLSGMRRLEEMEKMLRGPHPDRAFEDLWETDILESLVPELYRCKGVAQPADYHHEGDVWEHTLHCLRSFTADHDVDVRLAALFHDTGKAETFALKERIRFDEHAAVSARIVQDILKRLQCPGKRIEKIAWLVEHHMMMAAFDTMTQERKAHWYYHPWFVELLQLFWIDIAGTEPAQFDLYETIVEDYDHFLDEHPRPPKPLLSGHDIMKLLGIRPGADVGRAVQALEAAQVRKEIRTRKEAENWLQQWKQQS